MCDTQQRARLPHTGRANAKTLAIGHLWRRPVSTVFLAMKSEPARLRTFPSMGVLLPPRQPDRLAPACRRSPRALAYLLGRKSWQLPHLESRSTKPLERRLQALRPRLRPTTGCSAPKAICSASVIPSACRRSYGTNFPRLPIYLSYWLRGPFVGTIPAFPHRSADRLRE